MKVGYIDFNTENGMGAVTDNEKEQRQLDYQIIDSWIDILDGIIYPVENVNDFIRDAEGAIKGALIDLYQMGWRVGYDFAKHNKEITPK